ncbi:hypothetical protein BH11ACT8_BH11ACT8_24440 [soil metagenome]
MNRRRFAVPLLIATLVAGLGGTSYAVAGARHHEARTATSGAARTSPVADLLRGSYRADFGRLSGTHKPAVKNKRLPEIEGRAAVGAVLEVSTGRWNPSSVRLSYQWLADNRAIRGATSTTLRPTGGLIGKRLSVEVTAKKQGYRTATASSDRTGKVKPGGLRNTAEPSISGRTKVGKTLTADPGSWSERGVTFTYQWSSGGRAIARATKASYRLKKSDLGDRITVEVTATKNGYRDATATSDATSRITR